MERFKEPKDPLELVFKETQELCAYACAHCGKVYNKSMPEYAKNCCKQYSCETCGQDTYQFQTCCGSCSDQKKMESAEEVEWFGHVYDPDRDKYFQDIDEAAEWYQDDCDNVEDRPEFLFVCDEKSAESIGFKMSDWVVDHVHDNYHEDAAEQLVDLKELDAFCQAWAKKQSNIVSYFPNYKKKARLMYDNDGV